MKSLCLIAACLALAAGTASAQIPPPTQSDELRITSPTGVVLLDVFLLDLAGASESGAYNIPGLPDGVAPPGGLPPPGVFPVLSYVALLEPLNDPIDPGTTPIIIIIPGAGSRVLSDLAISFTVPNGVGVAFLSDADPLLQAYASFLQLNNNAALKFVTETGQLQDVTAFLQTPYRVQVASDVAAVPEPAAYALLAAGLGMLGWRKRRRAQGNAAQVPRGDSISVA